MSVWQNQRFVPVVGFSRQNLFLVRDPPALSDVTGHLRFPSVSLEYASPPSGYKWADTEDGRNWCISDDRVDVLEMERELTAEEKRQKALEESLKAGLETVLVERSSALQANTMSSAQTTLVGTRLQRKIRRKGLSATPSRGAAISTTGKKAGYTHMRFTALQFIGRPRHTTSYPASRTP